MTEDEIAGWHHQLNAHEFGWTLGAGDGQGGLACCGSWGCKESDTTEQLNWLTDWPGLSCSKQNLHCRVWDLVLQPGIQTGSPVLGVQSFSRCTTRKVPVVHYRWTFYGSWQVYNDMHLPLQYHTEEVSLPWSFSVLCLFIPPFPISPQQLIFLLPFPECYIVGILLYVALSDWLLSLGNMHVFSQFASSFLFSAK